MQSVDGGREDSPFGCELPKIPVVPSSSTASPRSSVQLLVAPTRLRRKRAGNSPGTTAVPVGLDANLTATFGFDHPGSPGRA